MIGGDVSRNARSKMAIRPDGMTRHQLVNDS